MAKDMHRRAVSERNDFITGILLGALVIGWLLYDGIREIADLVGAPGTVTVTTRVPEFRADVPIGDGADAVIESATLSVSGVSPVSVVALVLAIGLQSLLLIGTTVLAVLLCLRLMRGVLFDRTNTRLTYAVSVGLLAAAVVRPFFRNMGLNGVFAALGGDFDGQWTLLADSSPLFIAAIAAGVAAIVFRRGYALQKDTEGLV